MQVSLYADEVFSYSQENYYSLFKQLIKMEVIFQLVSWNILFPYYLIFLKMLYSEFPLRDN